VERRAAANATLLIFDWRLRATTALDRVGHKLGEIPGAESEMMAAPAPTPHGFDLYWPI